MNADREGRNSLAELLADLAEQLDEVGAHTVGGATEFRRDGVTFAALEGERVDLRLNAEVAEAARRTPATSSSPRGREWVNFAPRLTEPHDLDRAEAWFLSAWRAAADSTRT
ncbi:hypothetical protein BH23CHL6_BH23CHL6_04610 [soil metagenome]